MRRSIANENNWFNSLWLKYSKQNSDFNSALINNSIPLYKMYVLLQNSIISIKKRFVLEEITITHSLLLHKDWI